VSATRAERVALVVGGVLRQAVYDAGAHGILLLDALSPEGRLASAWAEAALGAGAVTTVRPEVVDALGGALAGAGHDELAGVEGAELERACARSHAARAGTLLAHPANKTALLLGRCVPPEPLLPLGDLYASQVAELAGGWSGPREVHQLAARVGGIAVLDGVLEEMLENRRPPAAAMSNLPADAARDLLDALEMGRFRRRRIGLVPKLSARTPGIDMWA
jgi:hypothetical protein